jgi:lipoprotein-releasing system permease protein
MYELSIALKYLLPKKKQLSASIISLLSIAVISLVVWLIVVFFSVTHGLENRWVDRLIAMSAPLRVTPTEKYYQSYYYNIDSLSYQSNYQAKTILEKKNSSLTDPYDPFIDPPLLPSALSPDLNEKGNLKDLVQIAFKVIEDKGFKPKDYSLASAGLHLYLKKENREPELLSQTLYLTNYYQENQALQRALLPQEKNNFPESRNYPLFLAKNFKEKGVQEGDIGYFSIPTVTISSTTEGKIPVIVRGFFDPGMFPMGSRFGLVESQLLEILNPAQGNTSFFESNGIYVHEAPLSQVDAIKQELLVSFKKEGIADYFTLSTYKDFPYTKDFLQQLKSERNLFTIIASVILIVACSNIVSMLIILVNDKKKEIGALRAQGAEAKSIALIFGLCGMIMGFIGSVMGILLALVTLKNLNHLVELISRLQGFDAFNPVYFGDALPNTVSPQALLFVLVTTSIISLISGIIPAIRASTQDPAAILRNQ